MNFNTFLLKSKLSEEKNVLKLRKKNETKSLFFWEKCHKAYILSADFPRHRLYDMFVNRKTH